MNLRQRVAQNLKRIRIENGLSQEDLADRAGLYRNYIGMVERQENSPTVDTLEALADALQVDAAEILRADDADG